MARDRCAGGAGGFWKDETVCDGQYAPADVPSKPRDLALKDERRWRAFLFLVDSIRGSVLI